MQLFRVSFLDGASDTAPTGALRRTRDKLPPAHQEAGEQVRQFLAASDLRCLLVVLAPDAS